MNRPTLAASLNEAWLLRARRARDDYTFALSAPALFKPEWSERAEAEFAAAMQQVTA